MAGSVHCSEYNKMGDVPHHDDDELSHREKIGEIFRLGPDNLIFICSECDEEFPLFIQFSTHIQIHLMEIYSSFIASRSFNIMDHGVEEFVEDEEEEIEEIVKPVVKIVDPMTYTLSDEHISSHDNDSDYVPVSPDHVDHQDDVRLPPMKKRRGRKKRMRSYECYLCRTVCTNVNVCSKHVQTEHTIDAVECEHCGRSIVREKMLLHTSICDSNNAFKCEECQFSFHSANLLNFHGRRTHNWPPKQYKCDNCAVVTATKKQLIQHSIECRGMDTICRDCLISFDSIAAKMEHLLTHEKRYQCKICGHKNRWKKNMVQHMRKHSETGDFKCDQCPKSFKTSNSLWMHKTHSNHKPNGSRGLPCAYCEKTFSNSSNLRRHERKHTESNYLKCDLCDFTSPFKNVLRKHLMIHADRREFVCDFCPKVCTIRLLHNISNILLRGVHLDFFSL